MESQFNESNKAEPLLLELNKTGLSYLKYLQFNEAISYFKKAEKIVNEQLQLSKDNKRISQLAGVTFNNLACYYKKTKRPKVALNYLKKSLELQVYQINDWVSIGSTHLNICAIYSYLQKHEEAVRHVNLAIELLQKKIFDSKRLSAEAKSYWNIKMLCHYNKAIQEQHLKMYEHSLQSYKRAKKIATQYEANNVVILTHCDQAISRIETLLSGIKKRMISIIMKRKQQDQLGHHQFIRKNIRHQTKQNRYDSQKQFNRFDLYKSADNRRKQVIIKRSLSKNRDEAKSIERKTTFSHFKSLKEYVSQKFKTEPTDLDNIP